MKSDVLKTLKEELLPDFDWFLRDFGLTIVEEDYHPLSFGNSYVVLNSRHFRLRLIRDRGQVMGEVASLSEPENWWSLILVSEIIPCPKPPLFELSSVAAFIQENFLLLSGLFGSGYPMTKEKLQRRLEQRAKEWGLRS
jgi:hypothetical protein